MKVTKRNDEKFIIYPYSNGKPIEPDTLKSSAPNIYQHFAEHKENLSVEMAESIKLSCVLSVWKKSRYQTVSIWKLPNGTSMVGGKSQPYEISISTSEANSFLIASGFLLPKSPENNSLIKTINSSYFYEYLNNNAKKLPGKDEVYYNVSTTLLRQIGVN